MKKLKLSAACVALAGSMLLTSCIGSFALTNNVLDWNKNLTGNQFVNELVFIVLHIVPVYEISVFVDAVVLNSVEFWSGSNPMTANIEKEVKTDNGNFIVKSNEQGYTITKEGEEGALELVFDEQEQSWNVMSDGQNYQLFKMNNDGTYDLNINGSQLNVTPDAQGLMAARQLVDSAVLMAAR